MFQEINIREAAIMANYISSDHINEEGELVTGKTLEETLDTMELIDDLLVIMKSRSLLNKKKGLKRLIAGRIEMSLRNSSVMPGTSNVQLIY